MNSECAYKWDVYIGSCVYKERLENGEIGERRDWREEILENGVLYARKSGRGNRGMICSIGYREGSIGVIVRCRRWERGDRVIVETGKVMGVIMRCRGWDMDERSDYAM